MEVFIKKPCIDMFCGIRVTKDTDLTYEHENVKQTVKDLVLHTVATAKGEGYESVIDTKVYLNEGDILVYEEEGRGYIKPVEEVMTVTDAIEELKCIEHIKGVDDVPN